MNLIKKLSIAMVAAGSMASIYAESITFGVEIPPIASLIVREGKITGANIIGSATPAADLGPATSTVGGFTVITNMPKWNLYFGLANDGNLISKSGTYLKAVGGNYLPLGLASNAAITPGRIWLKFPAVNQIKGTDGGAATQIIDANSTSMGTATGDGVVTSAINSLTAVLANATTATNCTAGKCANNGWVYASDLSTASIDIGASISNVAAPIGIAGTYTETLYVTLVTAY
jgi:hypothetical protein